MSDDRQPPGAHRVGQLLRELRGTSGSSLRSVAEAMGVDPAYLSRVERGAQTPSPALTARAASYYETDVETLTLAQGRIPADVVRILVDHPKLIDELRKRYG